MSDVQIVQSAALPTSLEYAAEFGPGFIHIALSPDADPTETLAEALSAMLDCYPVEQLNRLTPSCELLSRTA